LNELGRAAACQPPFFLPAGSPAEPADEASTWPITIPPVWSAVQFIQKMQQHHRLTLAEIKKVWISGSGNRARCLSWAQRRGLGPGRPGGCSDTQAFCRETGLSLDQLKELQQARLMLPLEEGRLMRKTSAGPMYGAHWISASCQDHPLCGVGERS